jgi:hypothetical protein
MSKSKSNSKKKPKRKNEKANPLQKVNWETNENIIENVECEE